jgi:hypothetical protein
MNRYLIRLNGAPFLIVTCPSGIEPTAMARSALLGREIPDDVTVESAMTETRP